jgi:hypothetical protein
MVCDKGHKARQDQTRMFRNETQPQLRRSARTQPTAQAVGKAHNVTTSPKGAKEYNAAQGRKSMKPLLSLLKSDPGQAEVLSVQQVLALCGAGKLIDASECSRDFREYLGIATSPNLVRYLQTCLQEPFDRSGHALQDVVNELGRRLEYNVENGLYQGRSNAIGFDGLWSEANGHTIVVEVKTTDAYRINLDTIGGYRDDLIQKGKITSASSVLLVVGRQDTGDLEAQVRGSRHAWTVRIISSDALGKLVALKESTEVASTEKIHELLVPFEYTRLDKIIDIAFTVAEEASDSDQVAEVENVALGDDNAVSGKQRRTALDVIEQVRSQIVAALSRKYRPLVKKSRALYWSPDKTTRAAVTISKRYETGGFWYAYHPEWDKFLSEGSEGILVLGCVGQNVAYAIPRSWIHSRLKQMNATDRESGSYWHVLLHPEDDGRLFLRLKNGQSEALEAFRLPLELPSI